MDQLIDGKFVVKRLLRSPSTMVSVFLVTHQPTGQDRELRLLNHQVDARSPEYLRFLNEFQTLLTLKHPGLVEVTEVGVAAGKPYYATRFREARPIKEFVGESGMPAPDALRYAVRVADALAYLHGHRILHRDINASSVHVEVATKDPFLAEFSLVKNFRLTNLTVRGIAHLGQLQLTPEAAQDQPHTERTDLYQLGLLTWELLTGVCVMTIDFRLRPEVNRPALSDEARKLLLSTVSVDPAARPASVKEFLGRLQPISLAR